MHHEIFPTCDRADEPEDARNQDCWSPQWSKISGEVIWRTSLQGNKILNNAARILCLCGEVQIATLDHMLNKFYGYSGKEIPPDIYFNEKYLGESVCGMKCGLYHVDSGGRPQMNKRFSTNMLCKCDGVARC
jgi:hypothetical protein